MNTSTKNKIAALLIAVYTLSQLIVAYNWVTTDSPILADMGIGFALSGIATMSLALMCAPGVWQDQKMYKILALIILGLNALGALPGILFAPNITLKVFATSGVVVFIVLLMLLINRTPKISNA